MNYHQSLLVNDLLDGL